MVPAPLCSDSPGLGRACPWGEYVARLQPFLLTQKLEWVHEKHDSVAYHTHPLFLHACTTPERHSGALVCQLASDSSKSKVSSW